MQLTKRGNLTMINETALQKHREWQGKIEVVPRCPVTNAEELSLAYTPGVAAPCLEIQKDPNLSYTYTRRGNLVAVVTDGTAVLGLGDIGPESGMPVMEGKCALFKAFADVDAFPLCIRSKDVEEIVSTIKNIAGSFGGINLEDIAAPRCFEIERRLKEELDIPVFHDDQHGTAVVAAAALLNALKVVGKKKEDVRLVISGAGAAAIAVAKLLLDIGVKDVTLVDKWGTLYPGNPNMNPEQARMAFVTNPRGLQGTLKDAMQGADVFFGLSAPGLVSQEMVASMAKDPILFPMANPTPEIFPDAALEAGAAVVGTGRSDYPNQINNVLAFPGIFRGALDVRARDITQGMKLAAAQAIASMVAHPSRENILPPAFAPGVGEAVAKAVAKAAILEGVARFPQGLK